ELVLLRARTITPDGQVREVPPEDLHEDETRHYGDLVARTNVLPGARTVTKVFRFPAVQPGSVIEYVAVVDHLGFAPGFHLQWMSARLPVQVYQAQLLVSPTVDFEVTPVNLPASIVFQRDRVNDAERATIALENIDGDFGEAYQPPRLLRTPWWSFRTLRYHVRGGSDLEIGSNWADALGRTSRLLTHDNQWLFSFDWPDIDKSKCRDVACQVTQ